MQNIRCIHLQIYIKKLRKSKKYLLKSVHEGVILADTFIFRMKQCKPDFVPASGDKVRLFCAADLNLNDLRFRQGHFFLQGHDLADGFQSDGCYDDSNFWVSAV